MNMQPPISERRPLKLSVDDFALLLDKGSFDHVSKVELLDGGLYTLSPQKSRHVVARGELAFRMRLALEQGVTGLSLLIEPTISIPPHNMPEPDIAVSRILRVTDYYPADAIALAVEVSLTTLKTDLSFKKALYASSGIPEYWVVDIEARRIHQFWSAKGEDFREQVIIESGALIESVSIPGLIIATDGLI
jgi:Uma2 family endonuclease